MMAVSFSSSSQGSRSSLGSGKSRTPRTTGSSGGSRRGSRRSPREGSILLRIEESEPEPSSSRSSINTSPSDISIGYECQRPVIRNRLSCRQCFYDRIPKGKVSLLIFILNVIETYAFYSVTDGIFHTKVDSSPSGFALHLALQQSVGRLFYPLAGFVADVYLGRYSVIHIGLWLLFVAHGFLAMGFSLHSHVPHVVTSDVLPIIAYVFVSLGSAAFEANIIPFGVDQLSPGASSSEISSYFYWYYFGRQLGSLGGFLIYFAVFRPYISPPIDTSSSEYHVLSTVQPMVAAILLVVAIVLLHCFRKWLFRDITRPNPLKLVSKVIWYAATAKRQMANYRRTFRYGEERKPRIELAKIDYDGIYASEEVEDVKTFCRILLLLFSLWGYFMTYHGAHVMLSFQTAENVTDSKPPVKPYYNFFTLCNTLTVLVCLPVLNHLILPCVPTLSMKKRIGFGIVANILALVSAVFIERATQNLTAIHQLLWMLLPSILLSVGELFVLVTTLEFIYAQSPESMKGLLTGMLYFVSGFFCTGGLLLFYFILNKAPSNDEDVHKINIVMWFFVILVLVEILGFVVYVLVACLYRNRHRPTLPEDEMDTTRRRHTGEWAGLF